ncbi:MAG: DUF4861 domain-containing protein [Dysgonamonadaceae bacterium]|nr:DUF4861 domain-containing protein [Dysgonamonadaceae bacterium]
MKRRMFVLFSLISLIACSKHSTLKLEVENSSTVDREDEIVEIAWNTVKEKLLLTQDFSLVVLDESGKQLPYQLVYNGASAPQLLIFPATVKSGSKSAYTIKEGDQKIFPSRTFGRQIPERKDDFAWENDRVVFRMYGPALVDEYPSNGVDMWLKKTDNLIIDKFYKGDLENHQSYHVDHGEGLDCYKVGHTLGAGGIAPYFRDTLWVGNQYDTYKVLENGPLRTCFELTYNRIPVGENSLKQTVTITLDAYTQMNKAVVTCEGEIAPIQLAGGIYLHDVPGDIRVDKAAAYIAYAEDATSDAGVPAGRNYVGMIFPAGLQDIRQDTVHILGLSAYQTGTSFTYYFGGGWNQWGFETDEDWFQYMAAYAENLKNPLTVTVPEQ